MLRIFDKQSTGKTRTLLTYAKENNCVVICAMPNRMKDKAVRYNLGCVDCISYEEFLAQYKTDSLQQCEYVVDELEKLVAMMFQNGASLQGYDMTTDRIG